jgi:hypothetical protein
MSALQQTFLFGVSAAVGYLLLTFASQGNATYPIGPSRRPNAPIQPAQGQIAAGTSFNPPPNYYIPPYFDHNFKKIKWFNINATQARCDQVFGKGATAPMHWMNDTVCLSRNNTPYFLFEGYI